jgi:hypothetical protein
MYGNKFVPFATYSMTYLNVKLLVKIGNNIDRLTDKRFKRP